MSKNVVFTSIPLDESMLKETDELSFVLKPSPHGGVGVFCTHGIKKGARIQVFPDCETKFWRESLLDDKEKAFMEFFAVKTGKGYSRPMDMRRMEIGWYMNHSDDNNTKCKEYRYFAKRDILAGEEITINYSEL